MLQTNHARLTFFPILSAVLSDSRSELLQGLQIFILTRTLSFNIVSVCVRIQL